MRQRQILTNYYLFIFYLDLSIKHFIILLNNKNFIKIKLSKRINISKTINSKNPQITKTINIQKIQFLIMLTFNKNIKMNKQLSKIQDIKRQNQRITRIIQSYLQVIHKQKQLNDKHQNQIENLLKFNQRLLHIIQIQVVYNRRDSGSLMPISQRSQRQSDLMNPLGSMIKTKKTIAVRSQKGTKSVVQNNAAYVSRLQALGKNIVNSQFITCVDVDDDSCLRSVKNNPHHNKADADNQRKYSDMTTRIQSQISGQIKNFNSCASRSTNFYQQKINQLNNLSNKIATYKPKDKFEEISRRIQMSPGTANLVKKAMMFRGN